VAMLWIAGAVVRSTRVASLSTVQPISAAV
jgi:hypothetical protein